MKYLTLIYLLFLFSCQANSNKSDKKQPNTLENQPIFPKVNDEFTLYLQNFKKLALPVAIKGCKVNSDNFKQFDGNQFAKYADEYSLAYGQIPTNGNYIATIILGAADCYLPVLTTYKQNGEVIDQKTIAIGGCGSDCGFNCEEYMTLRNDFTFYTSDTISICDCDSFGNEIPGTCEYYVTYRDGKLRKDGKIEMNKEIKKPLEGRKNKT
jgi:hypothetical protein